MGILLKELVKGESYWVAKLPTKEIALMKPTKLILTDIILVEELITSGQNYKYTYIFNNDLNIHAFDVGDKFSYQQLYDYIISKSSRKVIDIFDNYLNPEKFNGVRNDYYDYEMLANYLIGVLKTNPELLF